jgi:hypothetical protein
VSEWVSEWVSWLAPYQQFVSYITGEQIGFQWDDDD